MERNGTERNGTERNGTERNGTESNKKYKGILYWILYYCFYLPILVREVRRLARAHHRCFRCS